MAIKNGSPDWGVIGGQVLTTFLLYLFNRHNYSSSSSNQKPSKYTDSNTSQIDSAVPVVLGRGMLKSPLVSYYGDFRADPYTEEYGMHTKFDWRGLIYAVLVAIIASLLIPSSHPTVVTGAYGPSYGTATDSTNGIKFNMLTSAIVSVLISLLMALFSNHLGRTTIQKGFKYYLGWQNIICWTGDNIGIKAIWMNVYDTDLEESIYQGVWNSDKELAYKNDNKQGVKIKIDEPDMFGGVDEGGGFIGEIHVYLGDKAQPKDSWMQDQMKQESVQAELRGLTPKYPMYVTSVIPTAYIGKQATIPEMWFEIGNYSTKLADNYKAKLQKLYSEKLTYYTNIIKSLSKPTNYFEQASLDLAKERYQKLLKNGVWKIGRLGDDLNPAEALYQILTNDIWGCGGEDETLDIDSLLSLGATCEDEELGISVVYDETSDASTLVDKILTHINGVRFNDPKTGKLTFKLLRNDYDEDNLKVFNVSNSNGLKFTRLDWHETIATISASFTDAEHYFDKGQLFVSDMGNIKITHTQKQTTIDASYFTTATNARVMAQTQLHSLAYPLSSIEFNCNRYAYDLTVGEAIKVSWDAYGIKEQIFRVTSVDYGTLTSGEIKVSAIEDVFSFDKTEYMLSHGMGWVDPIYHPVKAERFLYFEMPYELTISLDTYIYAIVVKPASYITAWNLWNYEDNAFFKTLQTSTWSFACRLVYELLETYEYDKDAFIEITGVGSNSDDEIGYKMSRIDAAPSQFTNTSGLNLLVVDDEIISYNGIVKLVNGHYRLTGIIRGVFDTLPAKHTTERVGYFLDVRNNIMKDGKPLVEEGSLSDYIVEVTTETATEKQEFSMNDVTRGQSERRSERPSIMANLQFGVDCGTLTQYKYDWDGGSSLSGDLLFKFITRNKFNSQTIIVQTEVQAGKTQDGLEYRISCFSNRVGWVIQLDARDSNGDDITSFSLTWAKFCEYMTKKVKKINDLALDIYTYDTVKDLDSYARYSKAISYSVPRLAGIVTSSSDVQQYADDHIYSYGLSFDAGAVSPALVFKFNECPLIFVGIKTPSSGITGYDGSTYTIADEAYRVDGYNETTKKAILHKIEIDNCYIIQSEFTTATATTTAAYQYDKANNLWTEYTLQGE